MIRESGVGAHGNGLGRAVEALGRTLRDVRCVEVGEHLHNLQRLDVDDIPAQGLEVEVREFERVVL